MTDRLFSSLVDLLLHSPYVMLWSILIFEVVRGTVVDSNGTPACHLLEADVTLHARLCIGTCPVDRKGNVQWYPNSSTDKQVFDVQYISVSFKLFSFELSFVLEERRNKHRTHVVGMCQTAPFGRTRTNRTMRSPRSPQHGRADYSMAAYGSVTVYRGLQDLSPVDDSSAKYQEIWSTCKPHQVRDSLLFHYSSITTITYFYLNSCLSRVIPLYIL